MYAYIKGKITNLSPTLVYLEAQGVGYALNVSLNTYGELEGKQEAKVYTELIVREDELTLYGFITEEERDLFRLLISVSGIGPNTARIVLSSMKPREVRSAIMHEDVVSFKAVKGIGPKTAQRLIIELKDKVVKLDASIDPLASGKIESGGNQVRNEAFQALTALGFPAANVNKVLNKLRADEQERNTEQMIKDALRLLS